MENREWKMENERIGKSGFKLPKGCVRLANSRNTVPTGRVAIGPAMPLRQADPTKDGGKKK